MNTVIVALASATGDNDDNAVDNKSEHIICIMIA